MSEISKQEDFPIQEQKAKISNQKSNKKKDKTNNYEQNLLTFFQKKVKIFSSTDIEKLKENVQSLPKNNFCEYCSDSADKDLIHCSMCPKSFHKNCIKYQLECEKENEKILCKNCQKILNQDSNVSTFATENINDMYQECKEKEQIDLSERKKIKIQPLKLFYQENPQFFGPDGKIKYPINDAILHKNFKIFGLTSIQYQENFPEIKFSSLILPELMGDILEIWTFFQSNIDFFPIQLDFIKEELYISIKNLSNEQNLDNIKLSFLVKTLFQMLIDKLIEEIGYLFEQSQQQQHNNNHIIEFKNFLMQEQKAQNLSFYYQLYLKRNTSDKSSNFIKKLQSQNNIFKRILIKSMMEFQVYQNIIQIQNKQSVEWFSQYIEKQELFSYLTGNCEMIELQGENFQISEIQIIQTIKCLIEIIYSIKIYEKYMENKFSEQIQLNKERNEYQVELKKMEGILYEKQQKFDQLKSEQADCINIEEEEKEGIIQQVIKRNFKKQVQGKEKLSVEQNNLKKLEKSIEDKRELIFKIGQDLPFILNSVMYLGKDRFERQYWYFFHENDKLYISSEDRSSNVQNWGYILNMKDIKQLLATLCTKGINEQKLIQNLKDLLDEKQIEDSKNKCEENDIDRINNRIISKQPFYFAKSQKIAKKISIQDISQNLIKIESKFSLFLKSRLSRWEIPSIRNDIQQRIQNCKYLYDFTQILIFLYYKFEMIQLMLANVEENQQPNFDQMDNNKFTQVKRIKLKFWQNNGLQESAKDIWKQFLSENCSNSIESLYIAYIEFKNLILNYIKSRREPKEKKDLKSQQKGEKRLKKLSQMQVSQMNIKSILQNSIYPLPQRTASKKINYIVI